MPYTTSAEAGLIIDTKAADGTCMEGRYPGTPQTTASVYAPGAQVMDTSNQILYVNTGTTAVPVWDNQEDVDPADMTITDASSFLDSNSNEAIKFEIVASAVNEVSVTNAATGNSPDLSATGGDTNIDLSLTPKGTGAITVTGSATSGNIKSSVSGYEAGWFGTAAQQDLSGAGACNITSAITKVTSTGTDALTLADGAVKGQVKEIIMVVDGGDATLTPANATGFSTITFADVGDYAKLVWIGTGWIVGATYNVATGDAGPAIA